MALEQPDNLEGEKNKTADTAAVSPAAEAEHGAVKKKIDIPGVGEIEYTEKTIMFSEKIVQETGGVKGYMRKMVSWEELMKFWGVDKDEFGSLLDYFSDLKETLGIKNEESDEKGTQLSRNAHKKIMEAGGLLSIIRAMTENKFISETLNHIYFGHSGHRGLKEDLSNRSRAHNVMLEKLGDFEISEHFFNQYRFKIVDIENNHILSNEDLCNRMGKANCRFVDKTFLRNIKELNKVYFKSDFGLNLTESSELWAGRDFVKGPKGDVFKYYPYTEKRSPNPFIEDVIIGFKHDTENKVLRDYCQKVLEIYKNNFERNGDHYTKECIETLEALLENTVRENDRRYGKQARYIINRDYYNRSYEQEEHPRLPIILNHPDIPELRWCHADYAAIPTKNGYNIIEMIT